MQYHGHRHSLRPLHCRVDEESLPVPGNIKGKDGRIFLLDRDQLGQFNVSQDLYVPNPERIAVHFQHTEFGKCLLDIEWAFDGESHGQGKLLLRMEGAEAAMHVLVEAMLVALKHPRAQPSPADLFEDALVDRTSGLARPREWGYTQI